MRAATEPSPGIGPDDQKRRSTPRWAILEGVNYIGGREAILEPKDTTPRKAAERILANMESAFQACARNSKKDEGPRMNAIGVHLR